MVHSYVLGRYRNQTTGEIVVVVKETTLAPRTRPEDGVANVKATKRYMTSGGALLDPISADGKRFATQSGELLVLID